MFSFQHTISYPMYFISLWVVLIWLVVCFKRALWFHSCLDCWCCKWSVTCAQWWQDMAHIHRPTAYPRLSGSPMHHLGYGYVSYDPYPPADPPQLQPLDMMVSYMGPSTTSVLPLAFYHFHLATQVHSRMATLGMQSTTTLHSF